MSTAHFVQVFGLLPGAFVLCFLSGLVPFLNSEIFVIALAAMTDSPADLMLIAGLGSIGQILAMLILYASGGGVLNVRFLRAQSARRQAKLDRLRERMTRYQGSVYSILFLAASTGLPPVYMVSILCGLLRVNLWRFVLVGTSGRLLRFAILVWCPHWVKSIFA